MNSMRFDVKFQERNSAFAAQFGEVHEVSDGGFERGYAAGYADGVESVPDYLGMVMENTLVEWSNHSVTRLKDSAFSNCSNLVSIDCPNVQSFGNSAFQNCTGLKSLDCPLLTDTGTYTFNGCTGLKSVNFPLVKHLKAGIFQRCTALESVDFPVATTMGVSVFTGCSQLTKIILRNNSVCSLQSTNALTGTPIANGTGYVYVPAAFVEQYKTAANWSTYAAQIRAIEDYPEITGGDS